MTYLASSVHTKGSPPERGGRRGPGSSADRAPWAVRVPDVRLGAPWTEDVLHLAAGPESPGPLPFGGARPETAPAAAAGRTGKAGADAPPRACPGTPPGGRSPCLAWHCGAALLAASVWVTGGVRGGEPSRDDAGRRVSFCAPVLGADGAWLTAGGR